MFIYLVMRKDRIEIESRTKKKIIFLIIKILKWVVILSIVMNES